MQENLQIGNKSQPRYEFRSFGQEFMIARTKMEQLSNAVPDEYRERHSSEVYIISGNNDTDNVKIRNGKIDIKTLVQTVEGLEQWQPVTEAAFPIGKAMLENIIFPSLRVEISHLNLDAYNLEDFMMIILANPELEAVEIQKHRFGYLVNDTICEFVKVTINGIQVESINSESTEIADVKKTLKECGLEGVENINYIQAIKRVIGLINKPLAN